MLNDELNDLELARTLRGALPRMTAQQPPHDVWPEIVRRTAQRPHWSPADWSAVAVIVVALLMFPKWFWFLAYHL
jgi:hypothetical protein